MEVADWYYKVWQSFAVLLPVQSVWRDGRPTDLRKHGRARIRETPPAIREGRRTAVAVMPFLLSSTMRSTTQCPLRRSRFGRHHANPIAPRSNNSNMTALCQYQSATSISLCTIVSRFAAE